jgi:hypothetical protein
MQNENEVFVGIHCGEWVILVGSTELDARSHTRSVTAEGGPPSHVALEKAHQGADTDPGSRQPRPCRRLKRKASPRLTQGRATTASE